MITRMAARSSHTPTFGRLDPETKPSVTIKFIFGSVLFSDTCTYFGPHVHLYTCRSGSLHRARRPSNIIRPSHNLQALRIMLTRWPLPEQCRCWLSYRGLPNLGAVVLAWYSAKLRACLNLAVLRDEREKKELRCAGSSIYVSNVRQTVTLTCPWP